MSRNEELARRSLEAVWHPCTQMKRHERFPLLPIVRGEGIWLFDADGKRYLDGISSWWVNLFGHANPRIADAIASQAHTLEHIMLAGFTHEPALLLAETLSRLTGLGHASFGSDGASAVEIAIKMSMHYWKNSGRPEKTGFACLAKGYHGETVGALSVTDVEIFRTAYQPLLFPSAQLPTPDARDALPGESAEDAARRAAAALERWLAENHTTTAALIVEPLIQCAGGMAMHHPVFLTEARALCDRYQVHLIADEIAVGFGRSGTFFAHEQAGIRPDILCLSKGITGGFLPLSVALTRDEIFAAFYDDRADRAFLHSHSYTGNPLACRAALATLAIFEEDGVLAANRVKAERLTALLAPLASHPAVRHLRHTGMIWAFDLETSDPLFSQNFAAAAQEIGLLLRPIGNTVYLMPPYVLDDEAMESLAKGVARLVERFGEKAASQAGLEAPLP